MIKRIVLAVPFLFLSLALYSENKSALLIANGSYNHFPSLPNSFSEAGRLRDSLTRLGFQVTLLTDADREEMLDGIMDFELSVKNRGGASSLLLLRPGY